MFALLGSACIKALCKMLIKLTTGAGGLSCQGQFGEMLYCNEQNPCPAKRKYFPLSYHFYAGILISTKMDKDIL
jgi:hypothetical protein